MSKVPNTPANQEKCPCANCPSYNDCTRAQAEKLFCAAEIGKSSCAIKANGCICSVCPIHKEFNLLTGYYCRRGSAEEADAS